MRARECRTMGDVIKHILRRGEKQGLHTLEIEQVQNILVITYGRIMVSKTEKRAKDLDLVLSTKIKKDREVPMKLIRVKLDLCKYIEPWKSQKDKFDYMRENATTKET